MREIKFRGKTKDGKWLYGSLVHGSVITSILTEEDLANTPINYLGSRLIANEVVLTAVGQYTGLKDRNGKEIYEGDILRMYNTEEDTDYVTEVGEYGEVEYSTCDFDYALLKYIDDWMEYEVIGNIYDNPELLEQK